MRCVQNAAYVPAGTYARVADSRVQATAHHEMRAGTTGRAGDALQTRRSPHRCPGPPPVVSAPAVHSQTVLDEDGEIQVSAETALRMACDAAKITMRHGSGGEILDVGRRTRTISAAD